MRLLLASILLSSTLAFAENDVVKETIQLSPQECEQVATRVAIESYVLQGDKVEKRPDISKNAESVAKYIVEANKEAVSKADPGVVYQYLMQECVEAEGKTTLPLVVSN